MRLRNPSESWLRALGLEHAFVLGERTSSFGLALRWPFGRQPWRSAWWTRCKRFPALTCPVGAAVVPVWSCQFPVLVLAGGDLSGASVVSPLLGQRVYWLVGGEV